MTRGSTFAFIMNVKVRPLKIDVHQVCNKSVGRVSMCIHTESLKQLRHILKDMKTRSAQNKVDEHKTG
jgi:hypothetical protein